MLSGKVFPITLRVVVLLGALALATKGGVDLLWLLLVPLLIWDTARVINPPPPATAAAEFAEPGEYRVVLQVAGPKLVTVIRELRRTTGKDLAEAKQIVDDAPAVVAEGLSQTSAELVADRLRAAGAMAVAAPIGEM
jgi:ribosomal protein L7/L12